MNRKTIFNLVIGASFGALIFSILFVIFGHVAGHRHSSWVPITVGSLVIYSADLFAVIFILKALKSYEKKAFISIALTLLILNLFMWLELTSFVHR